MIPRRAAAWLAAALLSACGGPPPAPTWSAPTDAVTVPLVVAWQAARPLVEVTLDGHGPYLFVVNTGTVGGSISRPLAASLRLPMVGDPARGVRSVRAEVGLGALRLRDAQLAVVDLAEVGRLDERPVAGVLGTHLLRAGGLRLDPDAGTLTVFRGPPPPAPPEADRIPLVLDGDGRPRLVAQVGPHRPTVTVATGLPACALPTDSEAWASLPQPGPRAPRSGPFGLGAARDPCTVFPGPPAVGYQVLRQRPMQLERAPARLLRWPAQPGGRHLARFPDLPDCGPGLRRCLRAQVVEASGRLKLRVQVPETALPDRYWLRVNVGRPGSPLGVFIKPGAGQTGEALADARAPYVPELMRPHGAAVDVVDVVPLARRCPGEVCLR